MISFSRQNLEGREKRLERFFEILPGATSWTILLGMPCLAYWKPIFAAILIIAFELYWLLRLFYMTLFLILSYLRLSLEKKTEWMERVEGLDHLDPYLQRLQEVALPSDFKRRISLWTHRREAEALRESGRMPPPSEIIHHLVIFPVAKEGRNIIEPGIESLAHQKFPSKRILVVYAVEERASGDVKEGVWEIQEKYKESFYDVLIVVHPDGLPGEARVKGANVSYAAREAAAYLERKHIPLEHVVVSCFDADTVVSLDYFGCLTYHFMISPDRNQVSFQPIPVYHNNIWEAPGLARVLDIGSSFFQLIEATHPEKLVTFSSHSMSGSALVEVGYWPVDMISDDSAIFWKSYLHFEGRYRVVPMYVTLSMDVVSAGSWWKTIRNVYRQKRRWAWGVENFPLVMRGFLKSDTIPLTQKIRHSFKLFEGHVAWATWPLLLAVVGWIPALFAGREFSDTVFYYSAPRITATIFHLAFLSLLTTVLLSLGLLPKHNVKHPLRKKIGLALEWLLVPLSATFLSALPALDAQTRLLFGKYMEFWVTDKSRR